jgi:hypothetical protein
MKYCSRCKTMKKYTSPYSKGNGVYYYMCRECNTERAKKYRKTDTGRTNIYKAVYKSIEKHREKQNARANLYYNVQKGKVIKPSKCQKCRKKAPLEAHHKDYSKPLDVIWVCKCCHVKLDKYLASRRRMMYN